MKFEASRVVQTVEQLGDARFAGPDRPSRVLDFLAEGFSAPLANRTAEDVKLLIARPAANARRARVVFLVPR